MSDFASMDRNDPVAGGRPRRESAAYASDSRSASVGATHVVAQMPDLGSPAVELPRQRRRRLQQRATRRPQYPAPSARLIVGGGVLGLVVLTAIVITVFSRGGGNNNEPLVSSDDSARKAVIQDYSGDLDISIASAPNAYDMNAFASGGPARTPAPGASTGAIPGQGFSATGAYAPGWGTSQPVMAEAAPPFGGGPQASSAPMTSGASQWDWGASTAASSVDPRTAATPGDRAAVAGRGVETAWPQPAPRDMGGYNFQAEPQYQYAPPASMTGSSYQPHRTNPSGDGGGYSYGSDVASHPASPAAGAYSTTPATAFDPYRGAFAPPTATTPSGPHAQAPYGSHPVQVSDPTAGFDPGLHAGYTTPAEAYSYGGGGWQQQQMAGGGYENPGYNPYQPTWNDSNAQGGYAARPYDAMPPAGSWGHPGAAAGYGESIPQQYRYGDPAYGAADQRAPAYGPPEVARRPEEYMNPAAPAGAGWGAGPQSDYREPYPSVPGTAPTYRGTPNPSHGAAYGANWQDLQGQSPTAGFTGTIGYDVPESHAARPATQWR